MATEQVRRGVLPAAHALGALALVAGFAGTWGQLQPTGYVAWDNVFVGLLAAGVIWASSRAPWWLLAAAGAAAGVAAGRQQQWVLVGVATLAVCLSLATFRARQALFAALASAAIVAVLCRLQGGPFFGATAIFGLALLALMAIAGLAGHTSGFRKGALIAAGVATLFMLVGALGFGFSAYRSKDAIREGNREARNGISALKSGDFSSAAALFHDAGIHFAVAQDQLSKPWAKLGRVVPVVAQNRTTAMRVVNAAAAVAAQAEAAARQIDPEALRVHDGAIDLVAVTALQQPVDDLSAAIANLQAVLNEPTSPWVPHQVTDRLAGVRDDVDAYITQVDNLHLAVQAAPGLLGADAQRNYFVAFSTPAEARSIGGFVGSYGVLTVDNGAISLSSFGRSDDLVGLAPAEGMQVDLPADFANRYGAFNFVDGAEGLVAPLAWKNIGISPDFPTMSSIVQQMYTATFAGATVDGMILMDPYPLAQLLAYTGPQQLDGIDTPIDSANAVDFILRDQYLQLGHDARVDLLDGLAEQTFDALLSGALPSPITAAKDLGPFVREHRLMMWTNDEQEQVLFDTTGLSGRFPPAIGKAQFGITFNNAGPNKMDAYLTHSVTTTERSDPTFGRLLDISLTLTNQGPASGLPDYVAANSSGYPAGTDYMYLSMYGPGVAIDSTRDGEPLGTEVAQELQLGVTSAYVDIAPGQSTVLTFTFEISDSTPAGGWSVFVAPSAQRA